MYELAVGYSLISGCIPFIHVPAKSVVALFLNVQVVCSLDTCICPHRKA